MNISEKLCLQWNNFQSNASTTFKALRNESDFADVTLVCEDNTWTGAPFGAGGTDQIDDG